MLPLHSQAHQIHPTRRDTSPFIEAIPHSVIPAGSPVLLVDESAPPARLYNANYTSPSVA